MFNINYYLNTDLIVFAMSFLNERDIISYHNFIEDKNIKLDFLNKLKNLEFYCKHLYITSLTNLCNIYCNDFSKNNNNNIHVDILDYKYVKNVKINNLYISNVNHKRDMNVLINNDYIQKITIDLGRKNNIVNIQSSSVKNVIFIACNIYKENIDLIINNCKSIENIKIIHCDIFFFNEDIDSYIENLKIAKNINVFI